jgi:glutathionylspermidine amidase/synthetase
MRFFVPLFLFLLGATSWASPCDDIQCDCPYPMASFALKSASGTSLTQATVKGAGIQNESCRTGKDRAWCSFGAADGAVELTVGARAHHSLNIAVTQSSGTDDDCCGCGWIKVEPSVFVLQVDPAAAALIPAECQSDCVMPFGMKLGNARGVSAYSNCSSACIDPAPIMTPHPGGEPVYTGIGWQCVEYARRYWLKRYGGVFGSVDTAADMWAQVREIRDPRSGAVVAVKAIPNRGSELPEVGDLLIYAVDDSDPGLRFGHVAVVVRTGDRTLDVAEQNWENQHWGGKSYARRLSLRTEKRGLTDSRGRILGWLRVEVEK